MATTTTEASPLELRLVVTTGQGGGRDVVVEAAAERPVAELVQALAADLPVTKNVQAYVVRTQIWLDLATPLSATDLRQGDTLVLSTPEAMDSWDTEATRQLPADVAALEIVSGPFSGHRYVLGRGRHVLGRNPDCDIALEDPSLSREHVVIEVDGEHVTVTDLGTTNGSAVDGIRLVPEEPRSLSEAEIVRTGRTLFCVRLGRGESPRTGTTEAGYVPFNRPPRVEPPRPAPEIRVAPPPDEPQKTSLPLAAAIAPLVMGAVLYLVTHSTMMLAFMALTPMMAVWTFAEERRSGKRGYKQKARKFREDLAAADSRLATAVEEETNTLRRTAPSAAEVIERARSLSPNLWERRPADADFLRLRVGSGDQLAQTQLEIEERGSETLRQEAEKIAERHRKLASVPVVVPLPAVGVVGIAGPAERAESLSRFLIVQGATLHSPRDVVICAAVADEERWSWLKWLPHAESDTSPLLGSHLAAGPAAARTLIESLREVLLRRREASHGQPPGDDSQAPFMLVLIDEALALERSLLSDLFADHGAHGLGFVWVGSTRDTLPLDCGAIVEIDPTLAKLSLTDVATGATTADVTADGLSEGLALDVALALAPLRDVGMSRGRGRIPTRISLPDLLGVDPTPEAFVEEWRDDGFRAVPVGVGTEGTLLVDLRRDGPHALIAGMTRYGKSELLRTLVASLAYAHPPNRLAFLLVDYKGGSAFKECKTLPHTVGYVTDLDEHLVDRALISLNAELRRREKVLNQAGADDLRTMEARDPASAPPSLVIVIDEFAALAKEVPDFVQGVVDIAQRGGSLGVHLVLATQRPAGVVTDNIRANTNLRIALRVNDETESVDVIGSPDAGRIPNDLRGRAFVRTGHTELAEFQAGYTGGRSRTIHAETGVTARNFRFAGTAAEHGLTATGSVETDLKRIVDAASEAARLLGIPRPRSPWLPAPGDVVPLESLPAMGGGEGATAVVGLLDEPALQRQRPCLLDLEGDGSLLVFGTSGSGKTVVVRTIAISLAQRSSPEELQLYGLDFATRGLVPLEELPHCGSVVLGEDEERVERLFSILQKTLARRRDLFAATGAASLSEFHRQGGSGEPRIVVLLDGYAAFAAAFERVGHGELVEALQRLVAEGRPLGVHFVITANRRASVPGSLNGVIQRKLVLRMTSEDEFASLGVDPKAVRGAQLPPGRGFIDNRLEVQCCIVGDDISGEGQRSALRDVASTLSDRFPGAKAHPVNVLPARVEASSLPAPDAALHAVIGIANNELNPAQISLEMGHFLVAGPYRSGRSNALAAIVTSLRRFDPELQLHLLAPRRSPLVDLDTWTSKAAGVDACSEAAMSLGAALLAGTEGRAIVVIDDGTELLEVAGAVELEQLVRSGRDGGIRVVASVEPEAARKAWAGWLRELRKDESGLLLDPQADIDGDLLGVRLPRRAAGGFPLGRGYLVSRGRAELVQVAGT